MIRLKLMKRIRLRSQNMIADEIYVHLFTIIATALLRIHELVENSVDLNNLSPETI